MGNRSKILNILIPLVLFISLSSYGYSNEPLSSQQIQEEVNKLGVELEEACLNYEKVRASTLAKQLVSYKELSLPIFKKLLWLDNSEAESIGSWGLGKIKQQESIDTLIDRFRDRENRNQIGSLFVIDALGEIGGQQATQFLENLLPKSNGIEINAAVALCKQGYNAQAVDTLIKSYNKPGVIEIINKMPDILMNRRSEIIQACIAILKDPKISEMGWITTINSAVDILVKVNYENTDQILYEALNIQQDEISKYSIVRGLGQRGTAKAKENLVKIRDDENIQKSPGLILKIEEALKGRQL